MTFQAIIDWLRQQGLLAAAPSVAAAGFYDMDQVMRMTAVQAACLDLDDTARNSLMVALGRPPLPRASVPGGRTTMLVSASSRGSLLEALRAAQPDIRRAAYLMKYTAVRPDYPKV